MNKELVKIKRKIYCRFILEKLIISLSSSLFIEGVFLLITKLLSYKISLLVYILVPIIIFILLSAFLVYIFWPKEKEIVKIIDETYGLKESYITTKEFEGVDTPILNLQREDTYEKISKKSAREYKFKISWFIIAILVFSIGIFSCGASIPKKSLGENDTSIGVSSSESSEDESSITSSEDSSQETGSSSAEDEGKDVEDIINDLKDQIDNSDLDDETKEDLKNQLDDLKKELEDENKSEDEKKEEIDKTEQNMNQDVEDAKQDKDEQSQDQLSNLQQDIKDAMDQIKEALDNEDSQDGKDDNNSSSEDGNQGSMSGGSGAGTDKGSQIYAADDLIYDPKTDSYVTYGELLTYYYSQVIEGMQGDNLPEDLEALIAEYFASLYNDNNN